MTPGCAAALIPTTGPQPAALTSMTSPSVNSSAERSHATNDCPEGACDHPRRLGAEIGEIAVRPYLAYPIQLSMICH